MSVTDWITAVAVLFVIFIAWRLYDSRLAKECPLCGKRNKPFRVQKTGNKKQPLDCAYECNCGGPTIRMTYF